MEITLLIWIWMVALTVLVILGVVWLLNLQGLIGGSRRRLAGRTTAQRPEAGLAVALEALSEQIAKMRASGEQLADRTEEIESGLTNAVQAVALRRFRAFADSGGDQSFALALADGEGNGVVLSALHGRGSTRVFAKTIRGWLSAKPLSDEEAEALAEAKRSVLGSD